MVALGRLISHVNRPGRFRSILKTKFTKSKLTTHIAVIACGGTCVRWYVRAVRFSGDVRVYMRAHVVRFSGDVCVYDVLATTLWHARIDTRSHGRLKQPMELEKWVRGRCNDGHFFF